MVQSLTAHFIFIKDILAGLLCPAVAHKREAGAALLSTPQEFYHMKLYLIYPKSAVKYKTNFNIKKIGTNILVNYSINKY